VSTKEPLTQDDVFELLSSARRRYVLYLLREADEPMKLTELASQVAAWEYDTDVDDLTEQERKRVYVSLYQTHIPHLDDAGVVAYDKDTGMVALEPDAKAVDTYLETPDSGISWEWVYLALAATSAVLLTLTVLDILFFEAISESGMSVVILAAFLIAAVAHTILRMQAKQDAPSELKKRI
jgi:hypothetical protein